MNGLKFPCQIDWEVTQECCENCIHCYNHWRKCDFLIQEDIKDEEYYESIAQKICEAKPVSVVITGGEPLLIFNKIEKAILYIVNQDIHLSINTNVAMITNEIAEFFKKYNIFVFVSFPCSRADVCDEITGVKGSLSRIIDGIELLDKYCVEYALNMVVSKKNLPYIMETAEYVSKKFRTNRFLATKASMPANAEISFREMLLTHDEYTQMLTDLIEVKSRFRLNVDTAWACALCGFETEEIINQFAFRRRCGAGKYSFAISTDGGIKACAVDSVVYGNILEDDFSDVIKKMIDWQCNEFLPIECKNCNAYELCGGGCRLDAKNTFGQKNVLDSTTNKKNIGRKYSPPNYDMLEKDVTLVLKENVKFVVEDGFYRVSNGSDFTFVSNEFGDYLLSHKTISIDDIREKMGCDDKDINYALSELIYNNILMYRKEENV